MYWQEKIIKTLNVKPEIQPEEEIRNRIDYLKDAFKHAGAMGFVLGISGGQDSTLAGRLVQMAVEELREEEYEAAFIAVRLPYGIQKDEADAQAALEFIQPDKTVTINIKKAVDALADVYMEGLQKSEGLRKGLSDINKGNVKARIRMTVQYAIANQHSCLVVGTDHAAEAVTGFFTKYGDGGADVLPLAGLNKRQGRQLLIALQAPSVLYLKRPTADLLDDYPQQPDEVELGVSYEEIDDFLEGKTIGLTARESIVLQYLLTQHKRELPSSPFHRWWEW